MVTLFNGVIEQVQRMSKPFFTIGHSTRPINEFLELLHAAAIELVADVRTVPRSRTNPQFNSDVLCETLECHQIGYEHIAALGGLRARSRQTPQSTNGFWTNPSFHNYADYAMTETFREGIAELQRIGERRTAIMCAETVWWRCHRRIITDYLLAAGEQAFHILAKNSIRPAIMTPAARQGPYRTLIYPAPE